MDTNKILEIQQQLREGRPLCSYDNDALRYVQRPIGQGLYKHSIENNPYEQIPYKNPKGGRPKAKVLTSPNDIINCKVCGQEVTRSNQSHHKKTKSCQLHAKLHEKLRDLLID